MGKLTIRENKGTADYPVIGDMRISSEIGRKCKHLHIYFPCPKCGKPRWIRNTEKARCCLCHSCEQRQRPPMTREVIKKIAEAHMLKWDKRELEKLYINEKLSSIAIGELKGCSDKAVQYALRRYGISQRTRGQAISISHRGLMKVWLDIDMIKHLYWDEYMNLADVSKCLGVSVNTMTNIMRRNNIPIRIQKAVSSLLRIRGNKGTIDYPAFGDIRTSGEIGKKDNKTYYIWFPCPKCGKGRWIINSKSNKRSLCQSCGARQRPSLSKESIRKIVEAHVLKLDKTELGHLYINQQLSLHDISKLKGFSPSGIRGSLLRYGIPIRKKDEAVSTIKYKNKQRQSSLLRWLNPEYRDKVFKAQRIGMNIKPNKPEMALMNILDNLYPREWEYTGDGSFIMGGLNPDFVNVNGKKQVIELFGDYYHNPELRKVDYKRTELGRIMIFNSYGYKTLVVWEHELKNRELLIKRLQAFNSDG